MKGRKTMQAAVLMKRWSIGRFSGTYRLTKILTERMVAAADGDSFPVCILRPTLVGCTARGPHPGYIGNSSGFTACIIGTLKGARSGFLHKN